MFYMYDNLKVCKLWDNLRIMKIAKLICINEAGKIQNYFILGGTYVTL